MSGPKVLQAGDPCPACGGELKTAAVPTDAQFAKAYERENPVALPPGMDTAAPEVRAELGALHRCSTCGYVSRFKDEDASGADDGESATGDAAATDSARKARRR